MRVGVGAARAARAAGFEVGHTHPAEQAPSGTIVLPVRQARGNSGLAGLNKRLLLKVVDNFADFYSAQKHR